MALPAGVPELGQFKGVKGDKGDVGVVSGVTATTLATGQSATATLSGPPEARVLDLGLPRGATGTTGNAGPAGQITAVTAVGRAAGTAPDIVLGGSGSARTIQIGIPAGSKGDKGDTGSKGDKGDPGDATTPATTSVNGVVRLATQAESDAGTAGPVPSAATMKASFDAWEALLRPKRDNAVFIGASNVSVWATSLSDAEGWVKRDYSIGGTRVVTGEWEQELDTAIADTTLDKAKVGVIIIAGGGNDAYNTAAEMPQVKAKMASLLTKAKASFPAARIIVVPGLWNSGAVRYGLLSVVTQMRDAAREASVEAVDQPWTWLMGLGSAVMADATHPNAAGYAIFTQYMRQHLRGASTTVQRWEASVPRSGFSIATDGFEDVSCIDGLVTVSASKIIKASGNYVAGDGPMNIPYFATLKRAQSQRDIIGVLGTGQVVPLRVRDLTQGVSLIVGTLPAGAASNELNVPPQSWPIGQ